MHHRSPVAWLGHKSKWLRLREGQRRLLASRHYPDLFPAIEWLQVVGLREFVGDVPRFQGRYSFKSEAEVAMYLMSGAWCRWKRDWLRYLYPSRYGRPTDSDLEENHQIAAWYREQGHQIASRTHCSNIVDTGKETFLFGVFCAACRSSDTHERDRFQK